MKPAILVVEDEPSLALGLVDLLRLKGYVVEHSTTAAGALQWLGRQTFQLVVLDVGLPDQSGFEVLATLRRQGNNLAILMLTARGGEADRVMGFELGVDDYLVKPFSMAELLGRVAALLRRCSPTETGPVLRLGEVTVDFDRFSLQGSRVLQALPARAYRVLKVLAGQRGRVVSQDDLIDQVWGPQEATALKTLQNLIVKIRHAIEVDPEAPQFLITVHGQGYRLEL